MEKWWGGGGVNSVKRKRDEVRKSEKIRKKERNIVDKSMDVQWKLVQIKGKWEVMDNFHGSS